MFRPIYVMTAFVMAMLPLTSVAQVDNALAKALVNGSPWRFTNKHVNLIQTWRFTAEGKLEHLSSHAPNVWLLEQITADQTIVHPSTAGGNTVTYSLDAAGNAIARHSKNPSEFKSINASQK